jgi:UDPglucose 6-dehydrogenase
MDCRGYMKVCIIGTGYVGLVTGACLAEIGHNVICVDKDEPKIQLLKNNIMPIYEPGLETLVKKNSKRGNLIFTTQIGSAVLSQDIIFICVGTPPMLDGSADLRFVEDVAKDIGSNLNSYKIIINKSTVPIGSGDWVSMIINDGVITNNGTHNTLNPSGNKDNIPMFDVVSNPEFLREGTAIYDTFFPDRIVLGSSSQKAIDSMIKLYERIIKREFEPIEGLPDLPDKKNIPLVETDLVSAEMIKYAANSFLATKISFINEISNICEKAGADVSKVAEGIGLDRRIGARFLNAGIGWGGSCFPKDVSALTKIAAEYGITTQLLNSAINVNSQQRLKMVQKAQETLKIVKGKTIGVLGISFKPNTDDTRDAPAITIMNNLVNLGAKVKAYDPIVKEFPESLNQKVILCLDIEEAFLGSDLIILATEWDEFEGLDYKRLGGLMKEKNFIDGRNFIPKKKMLSIGFKYSGIGM